MLRIQTTKVCKIDTKRETLSAHQSHLQLDYVRT